MDIFNKDSDWIRPLTKGELFLNQLHRKDVIYTVTILVIGGLGLSAIGVAIYELFTGRTYYGIDKLLCGILFFWLARHFYKEWIEVKNRIRKIEIEIE
jgi:uncharacterized membrane protein YdjX (TVP38/TMEM64 family)